jgi:putative peptidoglycan lipid II flippase
MRSPLFPRNLLANWQTSRREHHQILTGIFWVSLFVFFGRLAGAIKEVAIAYRYGTSKEVDAYLFIFNLVSWPVAAWFSVLTVVLIPLAAHVRHAATSELPRFRAELLGLTIVLGGVLGIAGWFGLAPLLSLRWTGLPPLTSEIAASIAPIMSLLMPIGFGISLLSVWMLTSRRHANTLLESVPAVFIAVSLLLVAGGGIRPLLWGTLIGSTAQLLILILALHFRKEIEFPRFTPHSPQWRMFWSGFSIMVVGQMLMSLITIIDQVFAAHLGTGAIATLNYANRLLALVLGMGALAITRATLPVFAQVHESMMAQIRRLALQWTAAMFAIGMLGITVCWLASPWLVRVLFERGAFTTDDTHSVTEVFIYGLPQIPFYFAALVMVSCLSSQRRYGVLCWSGAIAISVKVIANAALVPHLGPAGISLGWVFVYAINSLFLWRFIARAK